MIPISKRRQSIFASPRVFRDGAVLVFFCLLLLLGSANSVGAATLSSGSTPVGMEKHELASALRGPWYIEAQKLSYDQQNELYEAEGNVRISSADRLIQAAYASVDMKKRQADLWGNVSVQYGRNWLKGEHISWNLDSETGWVDSGVAFFADNNFFVQGESIAKTGEKDFELRQGFLTSCNPSDPDWKIQFNSLKINVAGFAWARNTSLWARSVPFAFVPVFGLPVEQSRQSGFLIPWAGYSNLNGMDAELPFYWAPREDLDVTFYARYLEKRGFMPGGEFRINNPQFGKGVWAFNFLHDNADPSFLGSEGYPYQAEDRFWVRGKHNLELPWGIDAKIDIDFASDKNFMQEFSKGSTAFGQSDAVFRNYFGRGILFDETSVVRESDIYLEKRRESDLFSLDMRYWQQLDDTLDKNTVQKLPGLSYTMLPSWLGNSPLYYTVNSSAVNYWRREGDREQRLDIYPRVYYPLHWGNYLDIEPSAGFRTTSYAVQWENRGDRDNLNERLLTDATVEASTRVNRVYSMNLGKYTAVEHAIRPEFAYEYSTQGTYSSVPHLDRLDLDQARNGVRYGFSTFLTAKEETTDAQGNPVTNYREWVRFRTFQFFNVEQPFVVQDPLFNTQVMEKGFSPIGFRLDIMPRRYLTLSYDADYDVRAEGDGTSHDLYVIVDSGKGHMLRVDYQRRQDLGINEITTEAFIKTVGNLYLNSYHDYSIDQSLLYKQGYGFRYYRGCWGIGLGYEREGNDDRVIVSLDLLGLGSILHMPYMGRAQYGEPRPEFQRSETWTLAK